MPLEPLIVKRRDLRKGREDPEPIVFSNFFIPWKAKNQGTARTKNRDILRKGSTSSYFSSTIATSQGFNSKLPETAAPEVNSTPAP